MTRPVPLTGAALALLIGMSAHSAELGLSGANFVEVGDSVAEMLDTNALAFSVLLLGAVDDNTPSVQPTSLPGMPRASATHSERMPCPGGGHVRSSVVDEDGGGSLSAGDHFATTFEACVVDGKAVTGRSEFVVAAHRFEGHTEITELAFRFRDLGTPDLRWNGLAKAVLRIDLQRGTEHYIVAYSDLAVTQGTHHMRWSFSLDVIRPPFGDELAGIAGRMSIDGLRLNLHQDEPYAIASNGSPRSGLLTASDDFGARLEVEAGRRRYAYRLFNASNRGAVPDSGSQSRPYRVR